MIPNLPLMPEAASTMAGRVDALYWSLVAVSAVISIGVAALIVGFAIRYRARGERGEVPVESATANALEIFWTVAPFFVFVGIFVWGASIFVSMRTPPADSLEVFVVGKRWMWKAQHLEGRREINELHVPVGRPVRIVLTSEDVIHNFFVPAFRVKQDAVPGRYTDLWFEATRAGEYHLFCAEFCGSQHSRMIGRVVALEPAEFQSWLAGDSAGPVSMADAGRALFDQLGCKTCHGEAGDGRGPKLDGLYGARVRLEGGQTILADEAYLRESILNPAGAMVAGYQPIMPTYKGLISEEGLLQLIAYIRSLAESSGPGDGDGLDSARGVADRGGIG